MSPPGSDWSLASTDSNGSVYTNRSNQGLVIARPQAPRIHVKAESKYAKIEYKGPDGSSTTDRVLDIVEMVARAQKCE